MQHLGEVGGVDATGAGADRDERLALVVLAGEQGADLELARRPCGAMPSSRSASARVVGVVLLLAELDQDLEVVDPAVQLGDALELGCWRATAGW